MASVVGSDAGVCVRVDEEFVFILPMVVLCGAVQGLRGEHDAPLAMTGLPQVFTAWFGSERW